ncbi:MAG: hypothetical protein IJD20_03305 [Oscillospiraceae bacterium]|nr:hypothetical protein [Oscillospiraceae bacterium]
MCNIAGYAGNRSAAPILVEMLRAQEDYDGGMSTGVATIHEGKLYHRRVVGDVDTLLRETDVLDLPGTIGIAHSRPGGAVAGKALYPCLSNDKASALVVNGTLLGLATRYDRHESVLRELEAAGYEFVTAHEPVRRSTTISDGRAVMNPEIRVLRMEDLLKQGMAPADAMARMSTELYKDNATVFLSTHFPDSIFALRISRPLVSVMDHGETYLATTRFAMPKHLQERAVVLPLSHACELRRDGVTVHPARIEEEPVCEITPFMYAEGYRFLEKRLRSADAPLDFDSIGFRKGIADLWPEKHDVTQAAHLLYELIYQFEQEGRLHREKQPRERIKRDGTVVPYRRWCFSLSE